jgi:hypothetical protein
MGRINCKPVCYWVFLFSAAIFLAGCVPEAEKSAAYRLYSAKCSVCHRLLPPENYSLEKLSEYIEKYGKEMTPEEKNRLNGFLKEYLESKSKK